MRTIIAWTRRHWPLGTVLVLLGVVTVVINPLRQSAFTDDWSYALTVRHLLETGVYRLDNWAAANPVFQVYWGALFARLFGFSFSSLKVSTLVLLAGGLGGMYLLAREHGLSAPRAGLLTLVLLANPLTLVLGFSYMTDIPYLACLVLGLAFYTRAIRLSRYRMAILGSVFAAAAILIRSFGVAFLPGLGLVWLFSQRKRETIPLFAICAALPLLAGAWQVFANTGAPNWAVPLHIQWQLAYVTNFRTLFPEMLWRLAVLLEYLAFFSLPLLPVALADWWQNLTARPSADSPNRPPLREWLIGVGLLIFLVGATLLGVWVLKRAWVMPIIDWNLNDITDWPDGFSIALSLIMLAGAFLYARLILLRYGGGWLRQTPDHERLLDVVTLGLLASQITYFQFGDEYLLHFLPFMLIVVGRGVGGWLDRLAWPTVGRAVALAVVGVLWVRGMQSNAEAVWAAGDGLLAQGVPARQIHSTWDWASYNGAFDDYLRAHQGHPPNDREGYFNDWLPQQAKSALYDVKSKQVSGSGYQLLRTIPYRDMLLNEQAVYVYQRVN